MNDVNVIIVTKILYFFQLCSIISLLYHTYTLLTIYNFLERNIALKTDVHKFLKESIIMASYDAVQKQNEIMTIQ